jgi:hypothetical protein
MEHKDKVNAILFIRPEANFQLVGDDLIWQDENQTQPTDAEIKAGLVAYKKAQEAELKAKDQAKETAEAKLLAIGLTVEDLKALGF